MRLIKHEITSFGERWIYGADRSDETKRKKKDKGKQREKKETGEASQQVRKRLEEYK